MSNNAPDTETLLTNLRDRAREAMERISRSPGVKFSDLLWAQGRVSDTPTQKRDTLWWNNYGPRIAETLFRATGIDDIDEAAAVVREALLAGDEWGAAITEAMERDKGIPRELKGEAVAYARRFGLLPDEAVNHVRVLPEQERGRWFFGFWTAPAGWPLPPPSAEQAPRLAEPADASDYFVPKTRAQKEIVRAVEAHGWRVVDLTWEPIGKAAFKEGASGGWFGLITCPPTVISPSAGIIEKCRCLEPIYGYNSDEVSASVADVIELATQQWARGHPPR